MIIPTLTYCPLISIHINYTQKMKIERLENRGMKVISNRNLTVPKIELIQRKRCCVNVYKCIQGFIFGVANGEFRRGLIQISPKFARASIPLSYFLF